MGNLFYYNLCKPKNSGLKHLGYSIVLLPKLNKTLMLNSTVTNCLYFHQFKHSATAYYFKEWKSNYFWPRIANIKTEQLNRKIIQILQKQRVRVNLKVDLKAKQHFISWLLDHKFKKSQIC